MPRTSSRSTSPTSIRSVPPSRRPSVEVGPIDILVNNSGVSTTQRLIDVTTVADFDYVFGTNVKGAFFVAQEVAQRMIARAKARPGLPRPHRQHRVGGRSARTAADRPVLHEQGRRGPDDARHRRSNGVATASTSMRSVPGYIRTEINDAYWETEGGRKLMQMLPRRRVGGAEDLDGSAAAARRRRIAVHQRRGHCGRRRDVGDVSVGRVASGAVWPRGGRILA